ncbi:MAG: threonine-phosphate decarboxylase CobD [Nitrospirales bacterium]|nr:threonine-phosphate decarboxylase CobD [Nitrospirales bacterium]
MVNQVVWHGGQIYQAAMRRKRPVKSIVDFSASINPLGPPSSVLRAIRKHLSDCRYYPDSQGMALRNRLAEFHGVSPEFITLGNGSAELIRLLPWALGIRCGYVLGPTFMEFERALQLAGARSLSLHGDAVKGYPVPLEQLDRILRSVPRPFSKAQSRAKAQGRKSAVFVCNPNSPTGRVIPRSQLLQLCGELEELGIWVVVDEAFMDFVPSHSVLSQVPHHRQLVVLRSFTKFYGMPGIRLGYVVGPPGAMQGIQAHLPPWSVSHIAQVAGVAALADDGFRRQTLQFTRVTRTQFLRDLQTIPEVRVYPSRVNFVMVELPNVCSMVQLVEWLEQHGILVRDCRTFSGICNSTIRLAVRRPSENARLVRLLKRFIQNSYEDKA